MGTDGMDLGTFEWELSELAWTYADPANLTKDRLDDFTRRVRHLGTSGSYEQKMSVQAYMVLWVAAWRSITEENGEDPTGIMMQADMEESVAPQP